MITQGGIDRVLTLDLHAAQIQGFFDIPVDNLYASPVFALDIEHHFKGAMDDIMVVSPDVGGVARARELAKRINAPLSIVDKRREKAGEIAEMTVIGNVAGKKCIIVDDICDTAGTLCKAAEVLIENGASEVHSYITHGVLSKGYYNEGWALIRARVHMMDASLDDELIVVIYAGPTDVAWATENVRRWSVHAHHFY
jgi:ribose-phosphate pyrophosphokinase